MIFSIPRNVCNLPLSLLDKKTLITLMRLRRAARRCRSRWSRPASQPLWSCCPLNEYFQSMIKCNAKAAAACESRRLEAITRPQGVWAQVATERSDSDALRSRRARGAKRRTSISRAYGLVADAPSPTQAMSTAERRAKAASAWSVFFFPNVSKNTCKHPPPNTRYISSADFSKTAVVKNNPMKKTVQ